ncbi:MAG: DUF4065 domain-containing protein [Muribaculaceae bacterium]|nr:DUF4065 domain-containing protein [Muribaculaceae bacterium]
MIDVRTAAKYLIDRYEQESGNTLDEMKLHKLLYFTQRESFVLLGKPMFLDKFEAWKYGPVMRCLRQAHWKSQAQSVLPEDSEYIQVLEDTLRRYASMDSWTLSNISHGETCWQKAKDKEVGSTPVAIETSDIEYDAKIIKYRRYVCPK